MPDAEIEKVKNSEVYGNYPDIGGAPGLHPNKYSPAFMN